MPKDPGYYWYKDSLDCKWEIVELVKGTDYIVYIIGSNLGCAASSLGGEWGERIRAPMESASFDLCYI